MNKILFTLSVLCSVIFSVGPAQAQTIDRLDPAIDALFAPDAKLVTIVDLGEGGSVEGPIWFADAKSPDGGYFLFCNRGPRVISRWSPNTELATAYDLNKLLPNMEEGASSCSGTAVDPEGRVVFTSTASHSVGRIEKDGKVTILANVTPDGLPLHRPNDITIKANGAIFFTDNSRDETGKVPPAIYRIKDGKVTQLVKGGKDQDITGPNGITLSPDGKVLYVNNSPTRKVYRYDVQADDTLANGRLLLDVSARTEEGTTDGMKTDRHGNIYDTGPGGLWIISPEGKHLGTVRIPGPDTLTNVAIGGPDGKTIFMTGHNMLFYIQTK